MRQEKEAPSEPSSSLKKMVSALPWWIRKVGQRRLVERCFFRWQLHAMRRNRPIASGDTSSNIEFCCTRKCSACKKADADAKVQKIPHREDKPLRKTWGSSSGVKQQPSESKPRASSVSKYPAKALRNLQMSLHQELQELESSLAAHMQALQHEVVSKQKGRGSIPLKGPIWKGSFSSIWEVCDTLTKSIVEARRKIGSVDGIKRETYDPKTGTKGFQANLADFPGAFRKMQIQKDLRRSRDKSISRFETGTQRYAKEQRADFSARSTEKTGRDSRINIANGFQKPVREQDLTVHKQRIIFSRTGEAPKIVLDPRAETPTEKSVREQKSSGIFKSKSVRERKAESPCFYWQKPSQKGESQFIPGFANVNGFPPNADQPVIEIPPSSSLMLAPGAMSKLMLEPGAMVNLGCADDGTGNIRGGKDTADKIDWQYPQGRICTAAEYAEYLQAEIKKLKIWQVEQDSDIRKALGTPINQELSRGAGAGASAGIVGTQLQSELQIRM